MSKAPINLDYLLEENEPAGTIVLMGVEYKLMKADLLESFLRLMAIKDKVADRFEAIKEGQASEEATKAVVAEMEALRDDLRGMIKMLCPDLPDEILLTKFSKLGSLQALFQQLFSAVMETLPESVKKNSGMPVITRMEIAETPKVS